MLPRSIIRGGRREGKEKGKRSGVTDSWRWASRSVDFGRPGPAATNLYHYRETQWGTSLTCPDEDLDFTGTSETYSTGCAIIRRPYSGAEKAEVGYRSRP